MFATQLETNLAVIKYVTGWQIGKQDGVCVLVDVSFKDKAKAFKVAKAMAEANPKTKWFIIPTTYETSSVKFARAYAVSNSSGNPLIFDSVLHAKEYVN